MDFVELADLEPQSWVFIANKPRRNCRNNCELGLFSIKKKSFKKTPSGIQQALANFSNLIERVTQVLGTSPATKKKPEQVTIQTETIPMGIQSIETEKLVFAKEGRVIGKPIDLLTNTVKKMMIKRVRETLPRFLI